MQRIFLPAVTVLNRMGYTLKFTLLWLLSLIAVAVVAYGLLVSLDRIIQPAQRQLQGLALIEPISRTTQFIQLHRGISTALLGGNQAMRGRRVAKEKEVVDAFKALEERLPASLAQSEDFRHIKENWERLRKDGLNWTVVENFAAHTRLIEQMQLFEVFVADNYLLTQDTEIASSYLIDIAVIELPHVLEHLGQLRAYGTDILAKKQITEPQKIEFKIMIGQLGHTLKSLKLHLDKAAYYNPAMQKSLLAVRDGLSDSARQITGLVTSDILTAHFATPPEAFLEVATVEVDRSYTQLYDTLLPTAESLIQARIVRAKKTLYTNTGIALLVILLVVYLSVSLYYAIVGSIQSLVRSARTFAGGNLHERVKLGTRDELSWVGDSFNEMADGFNAMLEARKQAEGALHESHESLHRLLNSMVEGVYGVDTDGNCTFVNRAFMQMLDYQNDAEVLGKNIHELIHHSHADGSPYPASECKIYRAYQTNQLAHVADEVFWRKDGVAIPVEYWSHPIAVDGVVIGAIATFVDITERMQAEQKLADAARDLHIAAIAFETQMAIVITDTTPKILRVNKAFEEITGYTAEEVIGQNPSILSAPEIRESKAYYEEMWAELLREGRWSGEVLDRRKSGEVYPKWLTITAVGAPDGTTTHYVGSFFDITDRKKAEQDIHQLAFYDPLTKLPNRRLLLDRLRQALAGSARSGEYGAIMFLDLDNFKTINDTKGHDCGDLLLIEAARRLQSCVREGDTVARLGGDEFVVMLEDMKGEVEHVAAMVDEVGGKILAALDQPYLIKEYKLHSTASIGINLFSGQGTSASELLRYADIAMYQAKAAGRNTLRFFDPEMQVILEAHAALEAGLHHALEMSEFELYYQPKVNLRTGGVSSAEVLLRWRHPQRGLVSPVEFIPSLEESGLIVPVGAWVLRTACMQARAWQSMGIEACGVAVNLSAVQFHCQDICAVVQQILRETGLEAKFLELEITESTIMKDVESAAQTLHELKALGIRLSVDDFGTGHSSLSYLKRFATDILKIDQSFVRDITTDPDDAVITRAIIGLAHNLGMKVVAEGVETEAQMAFLTRNGCDEMQGYYYSKPVPVDAYTALLEENRLLKQPEINSGRTLLIVDDEENILFSLKRLLRRDGYQIFTATSARQGFELLAAHPVGVIVSDQRMPEMCGTEFLSKVKEIYPDTIRIVLSGYTDLQSITAAINQGSIYKFLTKPWDDNLLRESIQKAFEHFERVDDKDRAG